MRRTEMLIIGFAICLLVVSGGLAFYRLLWEFETYDPSLVDPRQTELRHFYHLFKACYAAKGNAPQSLQDLDALKQQHPMGYVAAANGDLVIRWGRTPAKSGPESEQLLAYPADIRLKGGPMLFADGTIVTYQKTWVEDMFRSFREKGID